MLAYKTTHIHSFTIMILTICIERSEKTTTTITTYINRNALKSFHIIWLLFEIVIRLNQQIIKTEENERKKNGNNLRKMRCTQREYECARILNETYCEFQLNLNATDLISFTGGSFARPRFSSILHYFVSFLSHFSFIITKRWCKISLEKETP